MGHFCAVYCLVFDKTGRLFVTGSDDKLIKVWNSRTCCLVRTMRGHVSDIVDLSVSCDNRFLASAGNDLDVRIWWLHNGVPAFVLPGHQQVIANVRFSWAMHADLSQSLYSWGHDGALREWKISSDGSSFSSRVFLTSEAQVPPGPHPPRKAPEILCATIHRWGSWVAVGCSDRMIRIYLLNSKISRPIRWNGHMDRVEYITSNASGNLIVSGSLDGTVRIWRTDKFLTLVDQRILNLRQGEEQQTGRSVERVKVNMVSLSSDGSKVISSQSLEKKRKDNKWLCRIKIWAVDTGELIHNLRDAHEQPVFVVEAHPSDPRVMATAGYDARVVLWDIVGGKAIKEFHIRFPLDDRLSPIDFDARTSDILEGKWHPDGTSLVLTHKNGHFSILTCGNYSENLARTAREQFFQTDFGELSMDVQHNVIDLQAQVPPHLLP
ncbi:hypothetical protein GUITHDRAFT_75292, partial [Guillardia theta CCMP2712]